jgi:hypothetical protein
VGQTLLEVAANPKHLGAKIGFMSILHTWGQNLCLHPHVHCVVPGGGLSPGGSTGLTTGGSRWISCKSGFFLPVRVLSKVFRGKFIDLLKRARKSGKLLGAENETTFQRLLDASVKHDWVVYAKPPFGGPEQVLKYLSRYTHRIAISNRRLVAMDDETVTFKYKDYARNNQPRTMTLDGEEFLRRFLLHAVPRGFVRIRHFGLLANCVRTQSLIDCRRLLAVSVTKPEETTTSLLASGPSAPQCCPSCGRGQLVAGENLGPFQLAQLLARLDSS